tara:strand:- start:7634 stop:8026 length:393 start_codon:yes stop_codon:yes gene_type:complete
MMKQNAFIIAPYAGLMALAMVLVSADVATAGNRVKGEYAQSRQPLYRVGNLDVKLSKLCRQGLFKQRKILRLSIGYLGKNGKGVTGIALKGWNLHDPTGVAEDQRTYHFFNQGYSNCRVYVAVTPPPRRQ